MSEQVAQTPEQTATPSPFSGNAWVENAPVVENKNEPKVEEPKKEEAAKPETAQPVFNPVEFLKTNLGYETVEQAKAEIEELRKLKEQKPQELKFANEESEKFFHSRS